MARMSVYNVLHNLTRVGVVAAVELGPDRTIYELDHGWHHHFVCRRCGRILDVDCIVGAKPCLQADLEGAEVDEAAVTFRGLCPDCARSRRSTACRTARAGRPVPGSAGEALGDLHPLGGEWSGDGESGVGDVPALGHDEAEVDCGAGDAVGRRRRRPMSTRRPMAR